VVQKNTDVPSGAATADRSASATPRVRGEHGGQQCLGPPGRGDRVRGLDTERGDRGAGAAGRRVHEEPGVALPPQLDGLGTVLPGPGEAERLERALHLPAGAAVHGQLHEGVAVQLLGAGEFRQAGLR
jgi:hypothetical protein